MAIRHESTLTKEQIENNRQWLMKLRSGNFKQGKFNLKSLPSNGEVEYCCLGVACVGLVDFPFTGKSTSAVTFLHLNESDFYLSEDVKRKLGLLNRDGAAEYSICAQRSVSLTRLNDQEDNTFAEIADEIELSLKESAGIAFDWSTVNE